MTLKVVLCLLALGSQCSAIAESLTNDDKTITTIYQSLKPGIGFNEKLSHISGYFLGKPYTLGPLGEGATGRYDSHPLYRTDTFDCTTYVSTVLALSYANNLAQFKQLITRVRYRDDKASFLSRNHFMSADWNLANADKGFISDITETITDKNGKPIAKRATAFINKQAWFKAFTEDRLHPAQPTSKKQALKQLRHEAALAKNTQASIPYLPLKQLFNQQGEANEFLFQQIPHGAIIEIVRPNWALKKKIGTNLNVSHLGFAIRKGNTLYFREASQTQRKVIDIPLANYLRPFLKSPTIKGINVQRVNPPA